MAADDTPVTPAPEGPAQPPAAGPVPPPPPVEAAVQVPVQAPVQAQATAVPAQAPPAPAPVAPPPPTFIAPGQPGYAEQLEQRVRVLESRVLTTQLLDTKFMRRAFAAWGHVFSANLVIMACVYAVIIVIWVIFAMIFGASLAALLSGISQSRT